MKEKLVITPQTRIRQLIDAYPELEEKLIEMAPAFSKLRNPVLRNTIARVTTLSQAAVIGNIDIYSMLNQLRRLIGQETIDNNTKTSSMKTDQNPGWLNEGKIVVTIDARPMLEAGQHPINIVFEGLGKMESGKILKLITGFIPQPLIEKAKEKKYETFTNENTSGKFFTYFYKA